MDPTGYGRYFSIVYLAGATGFVLGGYGPARKAAVQFYAEHQHCPPVMSRPEAVLYYRKRNYRIMLGFMMGGMRRGAQVALVGAFYSASDHLFTKYLAERIADRWAIVREPVVGALTGSLFGIAGRGHRLYYAWRGVKYGLGLGSILGLARALHRMGDPSESKLAC